MAKKENMADKAYQMLCDKILCFELAPGQAVSDHLLSQELGMSRTPIREALVRLEQDGLIEACSDNKMIISQADIRDITEIYQARMAIECKAAEIILLRGGLNSREQKELEELQNNLVRYIEKKDLPENFAADDAFHLAVMRFAGNKRLIDFFNRLRMQIMRARYLTVMTPDWFYTTIREHNEIILAFQEGSHADVLNAINKHLASAIDNYNNILSNFPQKSALSNAYMIFQAQGI